MLSSTNEEPPTYTQKRLSYIQPEGRGEVVPGAGDIVTRHLCFFKWKTLLLKRTEKTVPPHPRYKLFTWQIYFVLQKVEYKF